MIFNDHKLFSKLAFAKSKCQKKKEMANGGKLIKKMHLKIINCCGYVLALKFKRFSKQLGFSRYIGTNETKVKLSNLHNEHKLSTGCQTKLTEKLKPTYVCTGIQIPISAFTH